MNIVLQIEELMKRKDTLYEDMDYRQDEINSIVKELKEIQKKIVSLGENVVEYSAFSQDTLGTALVKLMSVYDGVEYQLQSNQFDEDTPYYSIDSNDMNSPHPYTVVPEGPLYKISYQSLLYSGMNYFLGIPYIPPYLNEVISYRIQEDKKVISREELEEFTKKYIFFHAADIEAYHHLLDEKKLRQVRMERNKILQKILSE